MDEANREDSMKPGDEAPPEEPAAGETICPHCEGRGEHDGESCTVCGGTGRVTEAVGGG